MMIGKNQTESGLSYVSKVTVSVIEIRPELPVRKSKVLPAELPLPFPAPAAITNVMMNQANSTIHFPGSSLL